MASGTKALSRQEHGGLLSAQCLLNCLFEEKARRGLVIAPGFIVDIVFDFAFIVIIITERVVDLGE